jgi:hypothetical protein
MRHYTSPKPSATTTNVATTMCIVEQPRGMRERDANNSGAADRSPSAQTSWSLMTAPNKGCMEASRQFASGCEGCPTS